MEDIKSFIEKCDSSINDFLKEVDGLLEESLLKIDIICQRKDKPIQQSKKTKRLDTISDDSENSLTSTTINSSQNTQNITTNDNQFLENSVKQQSLLANGTARPTRAAKLKIMDLKEKPINSKLRRPSNDSTKNIKENYEFAQTHNDVENVDSSLEIIEKIPVVELSDDDIDKMPPPKDVPLPRKPRTRRNKSKEENLEANLKNIKIEKKSLDKDQTNENFKVNIKIERCSQSNSNNNSTEIDLNPPAKGKRKTKKKVLKHKPIKEEKIEKVETIVQSDKENIQSLLNDTNLKKNVFEVETKSEKKQSKKKENSGDSVYEDALTTNNKNPIITNEKESNTSNNLIKLNEVVLKIEKLKIPQIDKGLNVKMKMTEDDSEKKEDATFVTAASQSPNESTSQKLNDVTFSTNINQKTFVLPKTTEVSSIKPNETKLQTEQDEKTNYNNEGCNTTFNVAATEEEKEKNHLLHNSLITDDESQEIKEEDIKIIPKEIPKSLFKKKNEIFNPFMQSPVKLKVKAFEDHATGSLANTASPMPQRQTRTKTKLKQKQLEAEAKQERNFHPISIELNQNQKNITPSILPRLTRILTPNCQSTITPTQTNCYKKPTPCSASKVYTLQKTVSTTSLASSKGSSLSQENGLNEKSQPTKLKINQLAEEKKRLREMKTQMVLKTKEAKDKERQERLRKQMEEKEEKQRKIESEKRKFLDEVQKNLKMCEEIQRKGEKQKQIEYAKPIDIEKLNKNKEIQDKILKKKQQMQFKQNQLFYQQQQQQQLLQKQQNLISDAYKTQINLHFNFDMLNSDDSTDDEGKQTSKRPQPPTWSRSIVRKPLIEKQSYMPTKIIDQFFSVKPTTPDLAEIFPKIDPKYLKRNSSVVWNTPPRYSELPKY